MLPKNNTEKKEYRRQYVWKSVIGFFISYSFVFGLFVLLGEFFSGYSFYPDNHKANSFEIMVLTGFGLLGSFLVLGLFMKKVVVSSSLYLQSCPLLRPLYTNSIATSFFWVHLLFQLLLLKVKKDLNKH